MNLELPKLLVATEEVAGVDLVFHIVEDGVVAVGDDGIALTLELGQVVDDTAAEEHGAVGEGRFVDDDPRRWWVAGFEIEKIPSLSSPNPTRLTGA